MLLRTERKSTELKQLGLSDCKEINRIETNAIKGLSLCEGINRVQTTGCKELLMNNVRKSIKFKEQGVMACY